MVRVSKYILLYLVEFKILMPLYTLYGYCKLGLKIKPNIINISDGKNKLNFR
jgi:hypothetical protein